MTKTMEDQIEGENSESLPAEYIRNLAFQLSICYHLGFGTARSDTKSSKLLQKSGRSQEYRDNALAQIEISTEAMSVGNLYGSLAESGLILPIRYFEHYVENGILETAKSIIIREMNDLENALSVESSLILILKAQLGTIYREKGKWTMAENIFSDIIKKRTRLNGINPQSAINSMMTLSSIHQLQGRWNEAAELAIQGLDTMKRTLGTTHLSTIAGLGQVASIFSSQGEWKKAAKMLEEAKNTIIKMLGPEHPDSLVANGDLAVVYSNLGRL